METSCRHSQKTGNSKRIGVYFSGTGNTKYCVETFLHYLEEGGASACAFSIEDAGLLDAVKTSSEIIFAYPIYFSSLPKIVRDFILRHGEAFRGKPVYFLVTMGLFSGDGCGCAARLLSRRGAHVIGGLHVKMPDCIADERALKRPLEKNRQLIKQAGQKMERAARLYRSGTPTQDGLGFPSHMAGLLGQRLWFYQKTLHDSTALKIDAGKCTGCARCVSLCPMQNLSVVNAKAEAKGKCTMCYRCVNACPKQAITLLGHKVVCQGTIKDYLT